MGHSDTCAIRRSLCVQNSCCKMYNIHVIVQKCNIHVDDSDGDTLLIKGHLQTGFALIS